MPLYEYEVLTSASRATGTIEAATKKEAEDILEEQCLPSDHHFFDENEETGEMVPHKLRLISIILTEVE